MSRMQSPLRRVFAVVAVLVAMAASGAGAQTKAAEGPGGTKDEAWAPMAHIPNRYAVSLAFPARARTLGVSGRAELSCIVRRSGSITNCSVLSETPSGWGFGEGALKLSYAFSVLMNFPGHPIEAGSRVTVPVRMYSPYWYALDPPSEPGTAPNWSSRRPMVNDTIEYGHRYPRKAASEGIAGWVLLSCAPTSSSWLSQCAAVEEDPVGMGFAQAGIALVRDGDYHVESSAAHQMMSEGKKVLVPLMFNPGIAGE